jgi:hypothetical protein
MKEDGSVWFGYQVNFDKTGDATFRISFSPIAGVPFFEQAPEPREIHDGERVMTNVLEEPKTGRKAFDTFQVCLPGTRGAFLPLPYESGVPGIIPAGTALRLINPRLSRGIVLARENGISMDTHVSMNVPNLGRFAFSSSPGLGYKLEALAEGNTLRFVGGADEYRIEADAPFTDLAGAWLIWVRFEPRAGAVTSAVTPKAMPQDGPAPIEITGTQTIAPTNGAPDGPSGPALALQVKNVSTKSILAYSIQILFTNPETGKVGSKRGSSTTFIDPSGQSHPMLPGAIENWPKPAPFPRIAAGIAMQYTSSVDLVIFDDGTTWGPGTAVGSQQMLQNVQLWLANHSAGAASQARAVSKETTPKAVTNTLDVPSPLEIIVTSKSFLKGAPPNYRPYGELTFEVKNVSRKDILAYSISGVFTDPQTGRGVWSDASTATLVDQNGQAHYLVPGQMQTDSETMQYPISAASVVPANSIGIDLVVFADGTTWGPAKMGHTQQMLENVRVWLANHKHQE